MDRVTEAFGWPFRDPQWVSKLLIIGLIFIIPIVGWINGFGWMLSSLDNLRAGRVELAAANLSHLGRGVNLFLVYVIYQVAILVVYGILIGLGAVLISTNNNAATVVGIFLSILSYAFNIIASLGFLLALPAIVMLTERGGIGGGLNVIEVLRRVRATLTSSLLAGLMVLVATVISGLGIVLCCVGVIFTGAYATAMWSWIFRAYEQSSGPQPSSGQPVTT